MIAVWRARLIFESAASAQHELLDRHQYPVRTTNYFVGRVLTIDARTADRWGRLMARAARPLPAIDGLLAATVLQHDLTLVTRSTLRKALKHVVEQDHRTVKRVTDPMLESKGSSKNNLNSSAVLADAMRRCKSLV